MSNISVPGASSCPPGGSLGSGEDLRIMLLRKGGTRIIAELTPDSGHFTRALDKTSLLEMTATVGGKLDSPDCGSWSEVVPWATEILVLRDGRDAWVGPVTDVEFDYGQVSVTAEDLTAWWDRRIVPKDMYFLEVDASDIFMALHAAAMSLDPVPNFNVLASPSGQLATREYLYAQSEYTFDALAELSRTSIDWTAYGRNIIVGGQEIETDPRLLITDDMWHIPPRVRARGNDQATFVMVNAKENILGIAVAPQEYLDYYGRIDRIFDDADIEDQESATTAAKTRLDMLKDPIYIESPQGASLRPSAPVTLPELIPGMRVRLDTRSTCKPLVADFRLSAVDVNFNGSVQIDLQPLGTVDDGVANSA